MITTLITSDLIDLGTFVELVKSNDHGAIVTFSGNVRNHDGGKVVKTLTYEIHPSADRVLREIVTEIAENSQLGSVAVAHRYGEIPIGESAFLVAVSAVHRAPALTACSLLVEEVKARLPIWKHQLFADGTDEWVNFA